MSGDAAVAGLKAHSYPLVSTRPDADSERLQPFQSTIDDAAIVGLGEATHGTREFFELKHRLVRHLVAERGFRTVAIETDFVNTLGLDTFVRRGNGTARDALDDVILWVWKVEAMLSLVEWLRTFNEGRPPGDRVRLHGVSLSSPGNPARRLRDYLRGVDGVPVPESDRLDRLADAEIPEDDDAREEFLDGGLAVAETLRAHLDDRRAAYVEAGSARKWTVVRRLCRHLEQSCEWNRTRLSTPGTFDPEAFEQRDRCMAENVGWCLETDPGDGVVVWAHNAHVKRGAFDMAHGWADGGTMGEFLDREHGSAYRPCATDVARGEYRAVADVDDPDRPARRAFTAAEPPTRTTAAIIERISSPAAFFDVGSAATDPRLGSWFDGTQQLRAVPAVVDPDADRERRVMETDLAASFDGLFAVTESTPTVPLAADER